MGKLSIKTIIIRFLSVVGIACCVWLAGVILYVMFRPWTPARKTSCINNMKQLGTSLTMYYTDSEGRLPSSYLVGHSKEWNQRDFTMFASMRGDSSAKGGRLRGTWVAVLSPYMKNKDIVWCPSDPNRDNKGKYARVSYYYKAALDRAWYGDKKHKYQEEADFQFPSDQIFLWERSSFHWENNSPLRNGTSINVVFFDGHTATKRIADCGYADDENSPGPLPRSGKGEPAWFNVDSKNPKADGPLWNTKTCYDKLN